MCVPWLPCVFHSDVAASSVVSEIAQEDATTMKMVELPRRSDSQAISDLFNVASSRRRAKSSPLTARRPPDRLETRCKASSAAPSIFYDSPQDGCRSRGHTSVVRRHARMGSSAWYEHRVTDQLTAPDTNSPRARALPMTRSAQLPQPATEADDTTAAVSDDESSSRGPSRSTTMTMT